MCVGSSLQNRTNVKGFATIRKWLLESRVRKQLHNILSWPKLTHKRKSKCAQLVGGGALGYDVVAGFARRDFFGEGLAAGFAIVLLGIMLDRITQGAGSRRTRARLIPGGSVAVPGH